MSIFKGVALVTGAASGIGRETILSFAREGCKRLVLVDRDAGKLRETEKTIAEVLKGQTFQTISVPTDISKEREIDSLYNSVIGEFGRVDYVVNAAGLYTWKISLLQTLTVVRPGFRGSIVNIASQLGIVGRPAAPAYCGSKAAVISMTRCDAIDYSKDLIRVNAVCPGLIDTAMTRPQADVLSPAINIAPMGRMGTAQEVADCVLFLASSKASFVQGATMVVDGGYVIN
ncbi:3-oxoacyl-reductase [Fusarium heterosporum]|uniref:3-oxoacyl-reductase n=1 Tax=Fusarium heterosporum TaxID=42747 RepID=A0A8H5TIC3_FUSHE|nr:3-oxoacyl-reductase [Fusarium heterosporum]